MTHHLYRHTRFSLGKGPRWRNLWSATDTSINTYEWYLYSACNMTLLNRSRDSAIFKSRPQSSTNDSEQQVKCYDVPSVPTSVPMASTTKSALFPTIPVSRPGPQALTFWGPASSLTWTSNGLKTHPRFKCNIIQMYQYTTKFNWC